MKKFKSAFTIGCHDAFSPQSGLSKREYFAGLFMQSLLHEYSPNRLGLAQEAVKCADTLMEELENEQEK